MTKPSNSRIAPFHVGVEDARRAPIPGGQRSASLLERGSLELRFYAPARVDEQTPHAQDELYIVVSGSGRYTLAGETVSFRPGDALFAPAGAEHRFENFTDDFATWVMFYGPPGGEKLDDEP